MKEFLIEYGDLLAGLTILLIVVVGVALLGIKDAKDKDRNECYEIYATDNVILKKCEKYFERDKWIKER